MADQLETCTNTNSMKNILLLENTFRIKEEDDFVDDKVNVSETAIIVNNVEVLDQKPYQVSTSLDNITAEFSSSEVQNNISGNVKIEEGIDAHDIKREFDNRQLYCEHCQTYYEDYCIKCGMLVHILNRSELCDAEDGAREELPNNILEFQYLFGQFQIFAVKYIPEGVTFGPFTGLNRSKCPWKIKGGKFVVNKDKSHYLNWMQYVNHARNISEQNLLVFQYRDDMYYQSTREIQGGDELLVHFGEKYEDNLNYNVEMDFIPTMKHIVKDVFACTFCCFGFSSKSYLAKHKTICLLDTAGEFSIEELMQCPVCQIHLNQKEYFKHHEAQCCKKSVRKCSPPTTPSNQTAEIKGQKTHLRNQMYKCEQCKYRTKYRGELKKHVNRHYEVKMYKCGICRRRFTTTRSHTHVFEDVQDYPDHSIGDYVNAHMKEEYSSSQVEMREFKCLRCKFLTTHKNGFKMHRCCDFKTSEKGHLENHEKTKHLKDFDYRCDLCDFKTNQNLLLEYHIKSKHSNPFNYNCDICVFKSSCNSAFERHIKTVHFTEFHYKCELCNFKTILKPNLEKHLKTKHSNEFDYKCDLCDLKTNRKCTLKTHTKNIHLKVFHLCCNLCSYKTDKKWNLVKHIKTIHLKKFDYRCDLCDYQTNIKTNLKKHTKTIHLKVFNLCCNLCSYKTDKKSNLEKHIKTIHLKKFDYSCDLCDFQTNIKTNLEKHTKTIHLKEFDYGCDLCDFKTNEKAHLRKHEKTTHLKEFDYKCDLCDFKTNTKGHLSVHVKNKHLKFKEFNYKCELCDHKVAMKRHLVYHVKAKHLNTFDYRCDLCDYKTNVRTNLKLHVKTKHLNEYDYGCDLCDYKTSKKSNLEKHKHSKHFKTI